MKKLLMILGFVLITMLFSCQKIFTDCYVCDKTKITETMNAVIESNNYCDVSKEQITDIENEGTYTTILTLNGRATIKYETHCKKQ